MCQRRASENELRVKEILSEVAERRLLTQSVCLTGYSHPDIRVAFLSFPRLTRQSNNESSGNEHRGVTGRFGYKRHRQCRVGAKTVTD